MIVGRTLVTFAVPEEARPFKRRIRGGAESVDVLVTGMGPAHAGSALGSYLEQQRPDLVITSGFAGALRPGLRHGTVVFQAPVPAGLEPSLRAAGAEPARFATVEEVITRATRKRELRAATGADVVDMESDAILALASQRGIPAAVVRVISDEADEDLPLDFNRLTGRDGQVRLSLLLWAIARSPRSLAGLIRLGRRSSAASRVLATVLERVIIASGRW